jgi:hypothetical protein
MEGNVVDLKDVFAHMFGGQGFCSNICLVGCRPNLLEIEL